MTDHSEQVPRVEIRPAPSFDVMVVLHDSEHKWAEDSPTMGDAHNTAANASRHNGGCPILDLTPPTGEQGSERCGTCKHPRHFHVDDWGCQGTGDVDGYCGCDGYTAPTDDAGPKERLVVVECPTCDGKGWYMDERDPMHPADDHDPLPEQVQTLAPRRYEMRKLEKMMRVLNDEFRDRLAEEVFKVFGVEVESQFDILGSFRLVTTRKDEKPMSDDLLGFIKAYSDGFGAALSMVREADQND